MNFESDWQKIKKGDERAFEALFKNMGSSLYYFAFRLVHDEVKSEEIVHDVFIKLWQGRSNINLHGSLKAYLFRAVHNHAINWLVQQKTNKLSSSILISDEAWHKILNVCNCNSYLIEAIEARETEKIIQNVIDDLPEQCREVFKLSRFELKSNKEISEKFGISPNTVRTHIYRALEKIRSVLQMEK